MGRTLGAGRKGQGQVLPQDRRPGGSALLGRKVVMTLLKFGFPCGLAGKEFACNAGDLDSIPGLGRSPGEGNDNSLQYSHLENPMDKGAGRAAVPGVPKSWT